jgi:lipoyl(octanoyl) transferase
MSKNLLFIKDLGLSCYEATYQAMQTFTTNRTKDTADEIWILEHPPVYTLGLAGKSHHLLNPGNIPVVQVDRGGQVTYHGPGQIVAYILCDLHRQQLGVRALVSAIEQAIIHCLADFSLHGQNKADAPGVYIQDAKIASVGLRIRRGCSYHGLSLNVNMDLSPFKGINPCGFENLSIIQMDTPSEAYENVKKNLIKHLISELSIKNPYTHISYPKN